MHVIIIATEYFNTFKNFYFIYYDFQNHYLHINCKMFMVLLMITTFLGSFD